MMRLSELRPCDKCRGPLGSSFQVVRTSVALVTLSNELRGLLTVFGGSPHGVAAAESLSGDADQAVTVAGDKEPCLLTEFLLCFGCYTRPVCLAELQERRNAEEPPDDV